MQIPFIGEHFLSRDTTTQKVNLFLEINQEKKSMVMLGTPGMDMMGTLGESPCRGYHVCSIDETKLYAVSGVNFYSIATDFSRTLIGTIDTGSGLVSMSDNGFEILIVDGSASGYIYNLTTGILTKIADPNFLGGKTCTFLDGYFIVNQIDNAAVPRQGQRIQSSALYDGTTWNALDVAEAEGDPDPLVAVSSNHKELWLHGVISTEIWYNNALATGLPFSRMQGGIVEYGIASPYGHSTIMGNQYMLGRTNKGERVIVSVSGYQPKIISHSGINYEIGQMTDVADCESFSYTQEGHSFVVFNFPIGDKTLVFDATTGKWHRRKSFGMGRWRARCYAYFAGKHIVGDFQNGNIYSLNMNTYTENGDPIERISEAREIIDAKDDYHNIFVNEIQLNMELGVGLDGIGQGTDPQAIMESSKDNGKTWGAKHFQPLMKQGEFKTRIMWHRWGKARRRIFRLTITEPVKVVIRGAWIDAEKGTS